MTVKIERASKPVYDLTLYELVDGKAYEDEEGDVFICNHANDIIAFSICGNYYYPRDNPMKFREVNLRIIVEN